LRRDDAGGETFELAAVFPHDLVRTPEEETLLRKPLIAVVAALTALVVAAAAWAQNPAPTASLNITMSPKKVGTKKKPRSGRLVLSAETNRESKSTASKIEIWIPKGAKMSTRGLKTCSTAKLNSQGKGACPKASKAGTGEADALLNPYAANPAPIKFVVTAFVGGKNRLNFYLESESPEVNQALPAKLTRVSHRIYAQKLTINIAPNLQQPAPGVFSSLQRLKTSIGLQDGKNRLISLTDCPKAREHQYQLRLTFVPNPTPPATSTATAVKGAGCSG
jgi:hypothetical protein